MQFSCESCKTQLQIADEKVRGKRLIVRCKRCGAKIGISDPALGAARPKTASAGSAPPPATSAPPAASAPPPAAAAPAARPAPRNESDTESTRAMDSDLLEQALQASKADDVQNAPAAAAAPAAAPKPAAASADAAVWFAMLHGKQAGPMTRAELNARADEGAVGPRTYLWKDGMDAWQRAKDLPELQGLFPQAPQPAPAPPPVAPTPAQGLREFATPGVVARPAEPREPPKSAPATVPPPAAARPKARDQEEPTAVDPLPLGELIHEEGVARELFTDPGSVQKSVGLASWAAAELEKKPAAPRPPVTPAPRMFEGAGADAHGRGPFVLVVLAVVAIAAVVLWFTVGRASHTPQAAPQDQDAGTTATAASPTPAPPAAEKPAPPKAPETKPAEAAPTGLTADQVRKKLDENKSALQGCIDEALRRDPNLRVGKIHIATTIAPTGAVTQAKIDKNTVDQSPLGACLRRATKKIAFPAFSGAAFDVDIPIVVTAGE